MILPQARGALFSRFGQPNACRILPVADREQGGCVSAVVGGDFAFLAGALAPLPQRGGNRGAIPAARLSLHAGVFASPLRRGFPAGGTVGHYANHRSFPRPCLSAHAAAGEKVEQSSIACPCCHSCPPAFHFLQPPVRRFLGLFLGERTAAAVAASGPVPSPSLRWASSRWPTSTCGACSRTMS